MWLSEILNASHVNIASENWLYNRNVVGFLGDCWLEKEDLASSHGVINIKTWSNTQEIKEQKIKVPSCHLLEKD